MQRLGWVTFVFSVASIALNSFIVIVIMANRKYLLKKVFYLLVLHCSTVDLLRAILLSVWCLPMLDIFSSESVLLLTEAKKWIVIVLRSLHLLTIINLLLFTANEYIVVSRPLQHRTNKGKKIIFIFIVISWLVSFAFTLSSVWAKSRGTLSTVMCIPSPYTTDDSIDGFPNITFTNGSTFLLPNTNFSNVATAGLHTNNFYPNSSADEIFRNCRFVREGSNAEELQYPFIFTIIILCIFCLITTVTCYIIILKRIRSFKNSNDFNLGEQNCRKNCGKSDGKRTNAIHTFVENKYIMVIGSVLAVNIMFIVPYSTIQLMQYMSLKYDHEYITWKVHPKLVAHFLIGVHSVLQPLCYFRMKDFWKLATCKKFETKKRNNSRILSTIHNCGSLDVAVENGSETSSMLSKEETTKRSNLIHHKKHINYFSVESQI